MNARVATLACMYIVIVLCVCLLVALVRPPNSRRVRLVVLALLGALILVGSVLATSFWLAWSRTPPDVPTVIAKQQGVARAQARARFSTVFDGDGNKTSL